MFQPIYWIFFCYWQRVVCCWSTKPYYCSSWYWWSWECCPYTQTVIKVELATDICIFCYWSTKSCYYSILASDRHKIAATLLNLQRKSSLCQTLLSEMKSLNWQDGSTFLCETIFVVESTMKIERGRRVLYFEEPFLRFLCMSLPKKSKEKLWTDVYPLQKSIS